MLATSHLDGNVVLWKPMNLDKEEKTSSQKISNQITKLNYPFGLDNIISIPLQQPLNTVFSLVI